MPPGVAAFWVRVTVNDEPSAETEDVVAIGWLLPLIMMIGSAADCARFTTWPSFTAEAPVNVTLLKSVSGKIPRPSLGASSTHSADVWDDRY